MQAQVEDRKTAGAAPPDKLTRSQGGVKPEQTARISKETEQKEQSTRVAELARNVEERGDILVRAGDPQVGRRYSVGDAAALRTYTYRDSFSVTRAPNSQLKWVACAETDTACRSDGRLWTRSLGGQDASVDPQARSTIAIASSD